ncbi:hypothetical protein Ddye_005396 [Dipteronia dyeriana]|uniref:Uncharacterized protein n=1 Tax=Dipteronia dyeriana TaxID=168575 RepID=A0AAD9XGE1_9ROSI|nr:hypothetical protein Ddye_005396 [Dipteronia dyeriana]
MVVSEVLIVIKAIVVVAEWRRSEIMVFSALAFAKLLCVPIVMSYHTHVPIYTFSWLVKPMWFVIIDLTLVPSAAIAKDLEAARVTVDFLLFFWFEGFLALDHGLCCLAMCVGCLFLPLA